MVSVQSINTIIQWDKKKQILVCTVVKVGQRRQLRAKHIEPNHQNDLSGPLPSPRWASLWPPPRSVQNKTETRWKWPGNDLRPQHPETLIPVPKLKPEKWWFKMSRNHNILTHKFYLQNPWVYHQMKRKPDKSASKMSWNHNIPRPKFVSNSVSSKNNIET